jgi:hypothetical protein
MSDIDPNPPPDTAPKVRLLTLGALDQRTVAARNAKALIEALESDLGGPQRLSAGERAIVCRAAITSVMLEDREAAWLAGRGVDVAEYCALVNVLRRLLTTVGLERRATDVTDLSQYIAGHAAAAPAPADALPPLPPIPPPP